MNKTKAVDALTEHTLDDLETLRKYVFAGKARFTLVFQKTRTRISFYVKQAARRAGDPKGSVPPYFVMVTDARTVQADNSASDYFLGSWFPSFKSFKPSARLEDIMELRCDMAAWFFWWLEHTTEMHPEFQVWHSGICCKCGTVLDDPISVYNGIGPTCAKGLKVVRKTPPKRSEAMAALAKDGETDWRPTETIPEDYYAL